MTGKERLEKLEIKYSTLTVSSEKNGTEYTEVNVEDLVFLIQNGFKQAERVQELETTVDFYQSALRDADRRVQELESEIENWQKGRFLAVSTFVKEMDLKKRVQELEEQNKRYREALEEVLKTDDYEDMQDYIDRIVTKACQALEESK